MALQWWRTGRTESAESQGFYCCDGCAVVALHTHGAHMGLTWCSHGTHMALTWHCHHGELASAMTVWESAGVQGIPALVEKLQDRGCDVFLVSGGFREIINPVAETLGIPLDHVFANRILFKVCQSRSPIC